MILCFLWLQFLLGYILCPPLEPPSFINTNIHLIAPVNWADDFVTFVVNNTYLTINLKQLNVSSLKQLAQDYLYLSESFSKLVHDSINSITVYDILNNSTKVFTKSIPGKYYLVERPNCFWFFQDNPNGSNTGYTVFGLLDEEGRKTISEFKISESKVKYEIKFVNYYNGTMYLGVIVDRPKRSIFSMIMMLEKPPMKLGRNINIRKLFKGMRTPLKEISYNAIAGTSEGVQLIFGDKSREFSIAIEMIPELMDNQNICFDLEKFLNMQEGPCSEQGLSVKGSLNYHMIVDIYGDSLHAVPCYLSSPKDNVSVMLSYRFGQKKPFFCWIDDDKTINYNLPSNTKPLRELAFVDTKSGHFVLPVLNATSHINRLSYPLFECNIFRTCLSCEIYGFYHACIWQRDSCQKSHNLLLGNRTTETTCFKLLSIVHFLKDDFSMLMIKFKYKAIYGERRLFSIDGKKTEEYDCGIKICMVFIGPRRPREVRMYVVRRSGNPMYAKIFLSSWTGYFPTLVIGLVLVISIFALSLAYLLKKRGADLKATLFPFYTSNTSLSEFKDNPLALSSLPDHDRLQLSSKVLSRTRDNLIKSRSLEKT